MRNDSYARLPELIDRGWTVIVDERTGLATAVKSIIPGWSELTWSQQTYYKGKYRFNEAGILEIGLSEICSASGERVRRPVRDMVPEKYVTPDAALPGSNERLRKYLERSSVGSECRSYDRSAMVHIGPDGSAIYTNDAGWGPPLFWPHENEYVELDNSHFCNWEVALNWVSEAPCWACPECIGS